MVDKKKLAKAAAPVVSKIRAIEYWDFLGNDF